MREVFEYDLQDRISSRNNYFRPQVPFRKNNMEQKGHSYGGPSVSNKLPNSVKRNSLNTFKHNVKKKHLKELRM